MQSVRFVLICRCFCPSKEPGLPDGLYVSLYGIGRDRVSRWGEWEPTGGGPIPERDRRGGGLSLYLLGWEPLGLRLGVQQARGSCKSYRDSNNLGTAICQAKRDRESHFPHSSVSAT